MLLIWMRHMWWWIHEFFSVLCDMHWCVLVRVNVLLFLKMSCPLSVLVIVCRPEVITKHSMAAAILIFYWCGFMECELLRNVLDAACSTYSKKDSVGTGEIPLQWSCLLSVCYSLWFFRGLLSQVLKTKPEEKRT